MKIETHVQSFKKVRATNSTDASFPAKIPTFTEPTGGGVIDMMASTGLAGSLAQNAIMVVPYGTGSDDQTYSVRVLGWRRAFDANQNINTTGGALWIPVELGEVACTTGTTAGVTGGYIVATELFADTLTLTTGDTNDPGVTIHLISPANNAIAHFTVDFEGFQKVELIFQLNTMSTDMNALYALL